MKNPHCKIGNVRMKDRKIHALPVRPRTDIEQELADAAQGCIGLLAGDVSGYVICAWDGNGSPVVYWNNDGMAVPSMVIPVFVEECARPVIARHIYDD